MQPAVTGVDKESKSNIVIMLNLTARWTQAHAIATIVPIAVRLFMHVVITDAGQNGVLLDST